MAETVIHRALMDDPPSARLLYGQDVRDGLRLLDKGSVHVVCTSPPYWGLRDYGVDPQDWPEVRYAPMSGLPEVVVPAMQAALGLETNPAHYVGHLVEVFREIRRVLRKDGIAWLNLGDSYISTSGFMSQVDSGGKDYAAINAARPEGMGFLGVRDHVDAGLAAKNLVLTPHRVALALQADGWIVRNDIVWTKGQVMPEAVTDRCTRSHEYVFMLTQSRRYYFDQEAIREPWADDRNGAAGGKNVHTPERLSNMSKRRPQEAPATSGRNKRTVWAVNPKPYPGAHFACWPPALVEPMILSGTSAHGVCPKCGAQWARLMQGASQTLGWEPTCECDAPDVTRPVVLDPFSGSATTGEVALSLNRDYVGLDLNEKYLPLAEARLRGERPPEGVEDLPEEGSILDLFGE